MYRVPESVHNELKMNPGFIEALKRRAVRRELTDDLVKGLEDISAACMLEDFKNDDTLVAADRISKKLGKIHAKEAMEKRVISLPSKHFIETYIASFTGDPILNDLNNQFSDHDEDTEGFAKVKALLAKRNFEALLIACEEEIECGGEHKIEALYLRATIHLLMGDYKKALVDCDYIINDDNTDIQIKVYAYIKRAAVKLQLMETDSCLDDFKEALVLDPSNCDIFYHRGQYYLQVQDLKKAMDDYKKALSLNPDFAFAYMQKCYTDYRYAGLTQDDEKMLDVLKRFEEGLEKFPNCAEYHSLYAQVMCDRMDYEKAETYFTKALELEPDNPAILVHKGLLQLEWKEDVDNAIDFISEALKIDPKCEFAYETLGTIEVQRGDLHTAVGLFDKAISLAKSETELEHLFSLRNVALAQTKASEKLDILLVSDGED